MNSQQLTFEESVARATGEDLRTISARGFQRYETPVETLDNEDDREPLVIDWDALQGAYGRALTPLRGQLISGMVHSLL